MAAYRPRYACVTDGEPLAQPSCILLLARLCDTSYEVSLETSSALDVSSVDSWASKVLDLKRHDSAEVQRNRYESIQWWTRNNQIKLVICSWMVSKLIEHDLVACTG